MQITLELSADQLNNLAYSCREMSFRRSEQAFDAHSAKMDNQYKSLRTQADDLRKLSDYLLRAGKETDKSTPTPVQPLSDLEIIVAMFERAEIDYTKEEIPEPTITVESGYLGFYSQFDFNLKGQLVKLQAFE